MTEAELDILKQLAFEQYEQFHDGLEVLLSSDKSLYKAFGQGPHTKHLKPENLRLTSKERFTYLMGFIDALAWATRKDHIDIASFHTDPKDFEDPDETPEERANFYEKRYAGLSPEDRAELEAYDKENAELWAAHIAKTIKENEVLNKLILKFVTGEE